MYALIWSDIFDNIQNKDNTGGSTEPLLSTAQLKQVGSTFEEDLSVRLLWISPNLLGINEQLFLYFQIRSLGSKKNLLYL